MCHRDRRLVPHRFFNLLFPCLMPGSGRRHRFGNRVEAERKRRHVPELATNNVKKCFLFSREPKPVKVNAQSKAPVLINLATHWQVAMRPERRMSRMLEHAAPPADLVNRPDRERPLLVCSVRKTPHPTPTAAWRMKYRCVATWPVKRIPTCVPTIDAQCFVNRVGSYKESGDHYPATCSGSSAPISLTKSCCHVT